MVSFLLLIKALADDETQPHQVIEMQRKYAMASSPLMLVMLTATATLAAGQVASAQMAISPPGRLLAFNCCQCHGTNGKGPGFDKLAGKSACKLFQKMKKYQSREGGEDIMARHAMDLSDAQAREFGRLMTQFDPWRRYDIDNAVVVPRPAC